MPAPSAPEFVVNFPTIGDLVSAWKARHCRVPDRHDRGKPFVEYDWQFWCTANKYRVREGVKLPRDGRPLLNQAFVNRQHQVIAPQKMGKGPWVATDVCVSAVGPSQFDGWAVAGELYECEANGCGCGWTHEYLEGEPKGVRHPAPLVQIAATSDEQVANVWRPLTAMIALGPLKDLLLPRGEFIRIVGDSGDKDLDRIDRVTASARSRLGAPLTEAYFDETGLYTKSNGLIEVADTMRRNAAGMGGRTSETTNAFDPSEESYAQQTFESTAPDIFRYWRDPDGANAPRHRDGSPMNFLIKADRRKLLAYVYRGADHIILDSIEAEAVKIIEKDPAQAERFFGNRMVRGLGAWLGDGVWAGAYRELAS